jgi:hypothetical protein
MAEAAQNHTNRTAQLPTELIGLDDALLRLTPEISLPGPLISSWTYVVLTRPLTDWNKREWAIQELDVALDRGDLVAFVRNPETGALTQLLTSRWRTHQRGWHREIIISGVMKASIGDEFESYRDWDVVLLRAAFEAWSEQRASEHVTAADATSAPESFPIGVKQKRRGPKEKFDWELFKARFYLDLDNDDVPAHGDINFEQRAKNLCAWGAEHPGIGEANTPGDSSMRAKVTEWAQLWPKLKAGNR